MNRKQLFALTLLSVSLISCSEENTPQDQAERVEQIRQEGKQLQESVQDMRPQIDAEAQETINRVEKRIENQGSN